MSTTAAARYRVPAGLSHRNRRNKHAHLPSLRVFSRKIDWTRAGSALLALLVAATLTLICQGHDRGAYHQGPHLTFLDIFVHHHTPAAQVALSDDGFDLGTFDALDALDTSGSMDMAGMDMSQGDMHSMHMVKLAVYSHAVRQPSPTTISPPAPDATNPGGANIASAVTNSTSEATGISMLSILLLVSMLRRDPIFALLEPAATNRRKSQVIALAEPPPPRPA
jgi:hypothetical protein